MSEEAIRVARDGDLLTITLARPDKGNALRPPAMERIADAFATAAVEGARAVLLKAEGERFCVGADLVSANSSNGRLAMGEIAAALDRGAHRMVEAIWECPLPSVAAVRGAAVGVGLHAALACDFVVAESSAHFSEPFALRGFSVDSGGSYLLPRTVGMSRAKWMLYTGERVSADTALDWGLIHAVADSADDSAREIALRLSNGPTVALGAIKRLLQDHQGGAIGASLRAEAAAVEMTLRTDDFKSGINAFLGRSVSEFRGR